MKRLRNKLSYKGYMPSGFDFFCFSRQPVNEAGYVGPELGQVALGMRPSYTCPLA